MHLKTLADSIITQSTYELIGCGVILATTETQRDAISFLWSTGGIIHYLLDLHAKKKQYY